METLASQIKNDNALYISNAQKLRSEFDSAIKKIRVMTLKLKIIILINSLLKCLE